MNIKLALGGGFLVATIFWAGATYDRMGNMEKSLTSIEAALITLNDVPTMRLRINSLEGEVNELKNESFQRRINPVTGGTN